MLALGDRIKRFRESLEYSQDRLAALSGVARNTINNLEQGRGNPTIKILETLADSLGVSFEDLLTDRRLPQVPGGVQEAIDILTYLEALPTTEKAFALALIFHDESYLEALRIPKEQAQALRTLIKRPSGE